MDKMNQKNNLIKRLFSDKIRKKEIRELIEIDIVEKKMQNQWTEMAERPNPQLGEDIWQKIRKEYKMSFGMRLVYRFRQPIAAACAILLVLVSGYLFTQKDILFNQYVEIVANHDMLYHLPDSSEVWMQPNSTLRYAKNFLADREVWLKGNSMFHVRKYQGSTFRVHLNKALIEVRGTRFLIEEHEKGKNEITLFSGCIAFNVDKTQKQIVMKPMEKIFYDPVSAEVQIRKIERIEWKDDKFKFNAMPLNQLIPIINQLYHTRIIYEGKSGQSLFTGTIRQDESLDDVILKICFIMNLKKESVNGKILIKD